MHTARIWMALAIPGGAPGYDYDKEFGNNITHLAARTSQRLRVYIRQTPKVKGGRHLARFSELSGLPGIRRVGILRFQPCAGSPPTVIASAAKQSMAQQRKGGLLRRYAPRND